MYNSVLRESVRRQAITDEITTNAITAPNKAIKNSRGLPIITGTWKRTTAVMSEITKVTSDNIVFPNIFPKIMAGKLAGAANINANVPL